MNNNAKIIEIIKKRRLDLNLSLSEVARRMGIPKSTLSRYESLQRQFPLDQISTIASVLGLQPEDILGLNSQNTAAPHTSTTLSEINRISSTLKKSRQHIVLETAKSQLKEQETEKESASNIIALKTKASELTDEEFEKALDEAVKQTVAFDGKPLDEREQAIAKQMLKDAWEEDNGKR